MDNETHDLTEAVPTLEPETRQAVKKWTTIGITAAGLLLLADDAVKRFKRRKNVTVTVTDTES